MKITENVKGCELCPQEDPAGKSTYYVNLEIQIQSLKPKERKKRKKIPKSVPLTTTDIELYSWVLIYQQQQQHIHTLKNPEEMKPYKK